MTRSVIFMLVSLLIIGTCVGAYAHESQPGTLELRQVDKDRYEVTWRAPIYFGQPHPARLELPEHWNTVVEPTVRLLSDSQVFRRVVTVGSQGVEGSILRFPGLEKTTTDIFVRLNRLDSTTMTAVVRPSKPYAQLRGERTWYTTAGEYIGLGFHHILQGVDHLLFVLGLLLIVKGWVDKNDKPQERIYDVAVSGGRKIEADGRCKTPVGSTVNVENAFWTNTIGAPELIAVWKDPDFDPAQRAFYYVRVIEIPTPRWTAYDAKRFGTKPLPGTTMTLQERAYTSPIWYTPGK
jgi:hypothetical protein